MEIKNTVNSELNHFIEKLLNSKRNVIYLRSEFSSLSSDSSSGASLEVVKALEESKDYRVRKLTKHGQFENSGSSDGDGPFWMEDFTSTTYYLTKKIF